VSRGEAWLLHVANALVGGTGLVYGVMRYFMAPIGDAGVVNHPLQPLVQHAHLWTAPVLVFAFGHIWHRHAWSYYRSPQREGRRSGVTLLMMAVPMILSGYFIQTAVSEFWRLTWIVVHVGTALLWLACYPAHLVSHWLGRRRKTG
jgi:hypothetical protein